ncbi:mitochondrial ribosomal protein S17 [Brevipalpus obovatus]|uniref:mitochondrial ribosomal protein S17 n=1 Tax=Brevipalpus obovatus TaxID=246614 RepID=UPI003D9EFC9C
MTTMGTLLLAKCCNTYVKNVIRVAVPQLKFDSYFNWHFREANELYALDKEGKCQPGDWVLVRELPEKVSLKVKFQVEKLLYQNGNIICPLTGRRSIGYYYADDYQSSKTQDSPKSADSTASTSQ